MRLFNDPSHTSSFTVVGAVDRGASTGAVVGRIIPLQSTSLIVGVSVSVMDATGGGTTGQGRNGSGSKSGLHYVLLLNLLFGLQLTVTGALVQ